MTNRKEFAVSINTLTCKPHRKMTICTKSCVFSRFVGHLVTVFYIFVCFSDSHVFLLCVSSLQTRPAWTAGSQPSATALSHCMSSSSTPPHTHTHTQRRDHVLRLLTRHPHQATVPSCSSSSTFHSIGFICISHRFDLLAASWTNDAQIYNQR